MANTNFVCFACRIIRRYPNWTNGHRCQFCAKPLHFSYYKFRIPEKYDAKGWRGLRDRVYAYNEDTRAWNIEVYRKKISALLTTLASTDKRNRKYIADLQERIRENEKHINRWADWR